MPPTRMRHRAFTLIELLTVIAIIAILMALLLPAINAAKRAAQKAQAKNDLTQFVTAVKAFDLDYGVYPVNPALTATNDLEYSGSASANNQDLVNVLRADTLATDTLSGGSVLPTAINTRQTVYLDVPYVKTLTSPKNGLGNGSETVNGVNVANSKGGCWYDPWGNAYIIGIDANYDNYVQGGVLEQYNDVNYVKLNGVNVLQAGCVGGSFGADGMQGSAGNKNYINSDDVLSWQ